jgi:LacI family transcriptional regulator
MPAVPQPPLNRPATLADVGRLAGVSTMAVSAVLNGARTSSRIGEGTRERIVAAAARLRYRPNAAARALANRRMKTLGVAGIVGGGLDYYFLELFNGMLEAAAEHGENMTVFTLRDWEKDADRVAGFCDGSIDGMIIVAPQWAATDARQLPDHAPFVTLHSNHLLPGVTNIESDEETGAYEMVRHLVAVGHRRILHLTGPRGLLGAERRVRGYRRALTASKIKFEPELMREAGYTGASGHKGFRSWLHDHRNQPLPSAIFCANDALAIACLEEIAAMGLRVPEDISVAGFDDAVGARTTVPQLTTVRQPLRAMGRKAVELLLERVTGPRNPPPENVVLPVELVQRASVSAPSPAPLLVPADA